jgi:hypothetical protein
MRLLLLGYLIAALLAAEPVLASSDLAKSGHFRLGFQEEFVCTGAVFDDPQRLRMKCRKAPARLMQCLCSPGSMATSRMACSCLPPKNATGFETALAPPVGVVETIGLRDLET